MVVFLFFATLHYRNSKTCARWSSYWLQFKCVKQASLPTINSFIFISDLRVGPFSLDVASSILGSLNEHDKFQTKKQGNTYVYWSWRIESCNVYFKIHTCVSGSHFPWIDLLICGLVDEWTGRRVYWAVVKVRTLILNQIVHIHLFDRKKSNLMLTASSFRGLIRFQTVIDCTENFHRCGVNGSHFLSRQSPRYSY